MITKRRFLLGLAMLYATAGAAQPKKPAGRPMRVGIITLDRSSAELNNTKLFIGALTALGWVEGRDVVYDIVYAEGDQARLPALAEKILAGKPDVILAPSAFELRPVLKNTSTVRKSSPTSCGRCVHSPAASIHPMTSRRLRAAGACNRKVRKRGHS